MLQPSLDAPAPIEATLNVTDQQLQVKTVYIYGHDYTLSYIEMRIYRYICKVTDCHIYIYIEGLNGFAPLGT